MKKLLSAVTAAAILICLLPVNAFAANTKRVNICGNSIPADIKQICFVTGERGDILVASLAESFAPEFKKYYYVSRDDTLDLKTVAEKLPELQNLAVIGGKVKNTEALSELKNLIWLGFDECDGTGDISFLKDLTGLKKFRYSKMFNSNGCKSIKPVSYLKNLTELELKVPFDVGEDITPLKNLTKLKKLDFRGNCKDLYALKNMKDLKSVKIESYDLADISSLYDKKKLTEFEVSRSEYLSGKYIAKLKNLKSLSIAGGRIRDFDKIKELKKLKDLSLTGYAKASGFRSAISEMTQLESLCFIQIGIKDCDFLSKLKNLKSLTITVDEVKDISGLAGLTSLEELDLVYNEVRDISAVKNLKKLKYLNLNANKVSDLSPVSGLTELTYLGVSGGTFRDGSPILKLKKLEGMNISDTCLDEKFAEKYKKINPECEIILD